MRAVGVERIALLQRLGNPDYPAVEDGLALWADRLLGAGFDEDEVREMIVGQSRRLAGAAVSRRLLVIGAHSADFVWRAGGAIAVTTAAAGRRACSRSPTASAASPASSGRSRSRRSSA